MTTDDGSGFTLGQRVWVDDGYSEFEGTYCGVTEQGNIRVRDDDTGDMMIGSVDFVAAA